MRNRLLLMLTLLGLLLALGACRQSADTSAPPDIRYGEDVCDRCQMIINEERYAAAYWTAGGQARRFDDIGGMLAYHQENGEEVASFWVHDYASGEWIPAGESYLVFDPGLHSPMGFGVAACASEAQARSLAYGQAGAFVLPFDQALAQLAAGDLALDPNQRHEMEGMSGNE